MKKLMIAGLLMLATGLTASAQTWHTDYDSAKAVAQKEGKAIMMVFTGSDWCVPCKKLDLKILSQAEFQNSVAHDMVMVKLDFPKKSENALPAAQRAKNEALAERYNRPGFFPYVVVTDVKGNVLGTAGFYDKTPTEYADMLKSYIR